MTAQPGISLADVAEAISCSDILVAVRQNFPGELAKHGLSEAQKALNHFDSNQRNTLIRIKAADSNRCSHSVCQHHSCCQMMDTGRPTAEELRGRASLQFCVERSARQLLQQTGGYGGDSPSNNMRMCRAAVCLAAANEYICAEILELAGNRARDNLSIEITPRDIYLAIFSDEELDMQFTHCAILGASVIPVGVQF